MLMVAPGIFILPYTQLVFGLECAFRSLRSLPFQGRGQYDVLICLVTILLMLVGTWVPVHLHPQSPKCFASLVWFVTDYAVEALSMLSIIAATFIVIAITIFVRLSTVSTIDQHQRIAASRMVHFLILGVVSLVGLVARAA